MKKVKEIYKPGLGYEGLYQVSNTGKVISVKRKKALSPAKDRYGYLYINLCKKGVFKTMKIHRIVAEAFLGRQLQKNEDVHHLVAKDDNTFEHMIILPHSEHVKLHKLGTHHSEEAKQKIRDKYAERKKKKLQQKMIKIVP